MSELQLNNDCALMGSLLAFNLLINLAKEFREFFQQKNIEDQINTQAIYKFTDNVFIHTNWKDVKVGDIVYIQENKPIPCDIVILATSDNGQCFIQTKNLDGNFNLKLKNALSQIQSILVKNDGTSVEQNMQQIFGSVINIENQTPDLFNLQCGIKITGFPSVINLTIENAIFRGCELKLTS